MSAHDHTHDANDAPTPVRRVGTSLSRPVKTALLMVALVGGFYLLREHWNHVAGNWVYLLLLACPLMHLFHGHGGHGGHGDTRRPSDDNGKQ
ncbi:MAG: DUF2933 domain-containing protein [Rubrivivax sp.]|nr:DUF2933 domain-containing protein [Rubrivivax sp.]